MTESFNQPGLDALAESDLLPDSDRKTASEHVAHRIREMIHVGELSAGDRLPSERELSERLGLARLTLRAGLLILREEGYVGARRGRGGGNTVMDLAVPYQRWLDGVRSAPEVLIDATELRIAAETHAVRLTTARLSTVDLGPLEAANHRLDGALSLEGFRAADAAFHRALGEVSGSQRIASTIRTTRGEMFVLANLMLVTPDAVVATRNDHAEIYRLISVGDGLAAADAVEHHIRRSMEHVLNAIDGAVAGTTPGRGSASLPSL